MGGPHALLPTRDRPQMTSAITGTKIEKLYNLFSKRPCRKSMFHEIIFVYTKVH